MAVCMSRLAANINHLHTGSTLLRFSFFFRQAGWKKQPKSYLTLVFPDWQQGEPSAGVRGGLHQCPGHRCRPRHQALHGPGHRWVDLRGERFLTEDSGSIFHSFVLLMILNAFDFIVTVRLSGEQVGDIVSVIDMPPKEDTGWWRGKHGFQVSPRSTLSSDHLKK